MVFTFRPPCITTHAPHAWRRVSGPPKSPRIGVIYPRPHNSKGRAFVKPDVLFWFARMLVEDSDIRAQYTRLIAKVDNGLTTFMFDTEDE